jgi:dihydrodipicolinate synthase/N-acetylneuraminate lyase
LFVDILRFAREGNWSKAAELQILLSPVLKTIFDAGLLPATREILKLQGFPCGDALLPRAPMSDATSNNLRLEVGALPPRIRDYLISA